VLVGIALLVGAVMLLGGGRIFERTVMVETSFDESVEGLDIGSPVKIRGVSVGSVKEIELARDIYRMPDGTSLGEEHAIDVVVRIEVTPSQGASGSMIGRQDMLDEWIERGLRLRLTAAGITGVVYLEGDFWRRGRTPVRKPPWQPRYAYIPAAPSALKTFTSAAERVLERIEQVDVEGVLTHFNTLLATMNTAAGKLDLEAIQTRAVALLDDLHALSGDVRRELDQVNTAALTKQLTATLAEFDKTLADFRHLVRSEGGQIEGTIENVRVMSQNLRDLSETLRSYPSLLLLGEPPAKSDKGRR
jgi:paraquat-inducible protein B